jgi:D-glycero-alpha-D-manno-heptose 1-phosphate guanylyltransferase
MKAIVLAGGLGTRLRARVSEVPKPMAPISGKPFLSYLLKRLAVSEIDQITLSVGYKWETISDYFGNAYEGKPIQYAIEATPLGTGGAIKNAVGDYDTDAVLVINGDTLLDLDYSKLISDYLRSPCDLMMVVRPIADISRYGSVIVEDGHVVGFAEKGKSGEGLINAGVYILKPEIISGFKKGAQFSFEADLMQTEFQSLRPRAWISNDYFIDIGIPEDFDRAQIELPDLPASNQAQ